MNGMGDIRPIRDEETSKIPFTFLSSLFFASERVDVD